MTGHELLVLAHILLLAYWLGADLGQFYLSFHVRRPDLAPATRALLAKAMVALDQFPRLALVSMLPVGFALASGIGLSTIDGPALAAVWVASALWLALVVALHFLKPSTTAETLRRFDWGLRAVLSPVLVVAGIASVTSGEPFATPWLGWKVAIFGTIVGLGLAIRVVIRNFGPALQGIIADGSTPASEAALRASLMPAYPLVVAIWVLLVAAAALGVAQP